MSKQVESKHKHYF